jgi:hypothetical protein
MLGGTMEASAPADAMATALRGIGAAASLPRNPDGADALLSAAQVAYTHAAGVTLAAGAGIVLVTAIVAVTMFRDVKMWS